MTTPDERRAMLDTTTAFTVSDALIRFGIDGTESQGREAVAALYALGFEASAVALDLALAPRREFAHSVRA